MNIINTWKHGLILILSGLLTVGSTAIYASEVTIPNTFSAGDTVSSSKMNENFNVLETAIDDNDTRVNSLEAADFDAQIMGLESRITALEAEPKANIAAIAPTPLDDINADFTEGSIWVDITEKTAYILVDSAPGAADWQPITYKITEQGTGTILATGADSLILSPDADTVCGITTNQLTVTLADDIDLLTVIVTENSSAIIPGGVIETGQTVGMNGVCENNNYSTDNLVIVDDQR